MSSSSPLWFAGTQAASQAAVAFGKAAWPTPIRKEVQGFLTFAFVLAKLPFSAVLVFQQCTLVQTGGFRSQPNAMIPQSPPSPLVASSSPCCLPACLPSSFSPELLTQPEGELKGHSAALPPRGSLTSSSRMWAEWWLLSSERLLALQ